MQCLVIVYEFMSSPELNYSQLVKEDIPTKCFITFFFLSYLNFDFVFLKSGCICLSFFFCPGGGATGKAKDYVR